MKVPPISAPKRFIVKSKAPRRMVQTPSQQKLRLGITRWLRAREPISQAWITKFNPYKCF